MDRLIDRQMDNIEKAYEGIPMGGKLEFSKSAIEGLYQVLKELKEYKNLEDNGLLIKLPCDYNDTLYWIANGYVREVWFKGIRCDKGYKPQIICRYLHNLNAKEEPICAFENIGKTVFLTREEAELKLKEIK